MNSTGTPIRRPAGYRTIAVDGETWYWTPTRMWTVLVARNASTGRRLEATEKVVKQIQAELGHGVWDESRGANIIEPRHVAAWISREHANKEA